MDFERLRIEVTNYPAHAFELNSKLVKKTKIFELQVNLNSLKVESKTSIKFESEDEDCENFAKDRGFWILEIGLVKQINNDNSLLVAIRGENKIVKLVAVSPRFYNREIKTFLSDKLLNKNVKLTINPGDGSKETYFATVSENEVDISRYLIENGLAKYENLGRNSASDYKFCLYSELEKKAKKAKLGIWAK